MSAGALAGTLAQGFSSGRNSYNQTEIDTIINNLKSDTANSLVKYDANTNRELENLKNELAIRPKTLNSVSGNLAIFEDSNIKDSGYKVDDNQKGTRILWSSNKFPNLSGVAGNIPIYTGEDSFLDLGYKINDFSTPADNVLYSSKKIDDLLVNAALGNLGMRIVDTAKLNNFASFDSGGQVVDSLVTLDDTKIGKDILWSSDFTDASYIKKLVGSNLAQLSSTGQLIDSGINVASIPKITVPLLPNSLAALSGTGEIVDSGYGVDASVSGANILWTSDKTEKTYMKQLPGANLAQLGADGQLVDSGINVASIPKLTVPLLPNALASLSATGEIQDSGYGLDNTVVGANILWTSDKTEKTYTKQLPGVNLAQLGTNGQLVDSGLDPLNLLQKKVPVVPNSLAVLDSSGQVVDSGFGVDDSGSGTVVLWTSDKTEKTYTKQLPGVNLAQLGADGQLVDSGLDPLNLLQKKVPIVPNSLAVLDSSGQVVDSGFGVDDTKSGLKILWTSDKTEKTYTKQLPGVNLAQLGADGQLIDSGINPKLLNTINNPLTHMGINKNYSVSVGQNAVIYDYIISNPNNWYNVSNGRFTPTVAGYYSIIAQVNFNINSTGYTTITIRKNGLQEIYMANGIGWNLARASGIVVFNGTTDYISIHVNVYEASSLLQNIGTTYFNAMFLRP
jgi:hypothetical protein